MRNADYWRQRARINSDAAHAEANEYIAQLEEIYREAVMSVKADLDRWYGRFADNNQITLAEAKKRLTEGELEEFHWTVDKYIKAAEEHGLDPAWQKKLENASARYHISRLEAIQMQIQQQAELVYGNQMDGLDELLRRIADNGYNHAAFDVMKGLGMGWDFAKLDQKRLDAMLKKPWTSDGKTFTDRCWEGKANLIDGIQRELVQSLMRGDSLVKTRDRIADRFNVSKYKAGRLAHTEATYFNAVSSQACYEDLGVEKIEILETLDKHTCEICAAMDGKVIDKKDYQPGVTVPPFHPNCRGTTCPWFDDMADVGQRIARDNEGEVYYVPPDMTYREWEKKFKEGGQSSGDTTSKPGIPKQIGTVDFSDEKAVLKWLEAAERDCADLPYEVNTSVTTDGKVWQVTGNAGSVNPSSIPSSLKGSFSFHNHPPKETWYSFGPEDVAFFFRSGEAYSKASDDVYEYVMRRTKETVDKTPEWVYHRFKEIEKTDVFRLKWYGEIDPDLDGFHEVMVRLSKEVGIEYERRKKN